MRPSARKRGYTGKWDKARRQWLALHPWCKFCNKIATVVDHIIPHKQNPKLFWDTKNWQSLCLSCHSSVKQGMEARGYSKEIGKDGWPIDPKHPSNTR